jgi:hypothetical protein
MQCIPYPSGIDTLCYTSSQKNITRPADGIWGHYKNGYQDRCNCNTPVSWLLLRR